MCPVVTFVSAGMSITVAVLASSKLRDMVDRKNKLKVTSPQIPPWARSE
jgi:hypothetical protein